MGKIRYKGEHGEVYDGILKRALRIVSPSLTRLYAYMPKGWFTEKKALKIWIEGRNDS